MTLVNYFKNDLVQNIGGECLEFGNENNLNAKFILLQELMRKDNPRVSAKSSTDE